MIICSKPYECKHYPTGVMCTICENGNRFEPKSMTNAQKIRSMTDEELAEWFLKIQYDVSDYYCGGHSCEPTLPTGKESWLYWLRQEAE